MLDFKMISIYMKRQFNLHNMQFFSPYVCSYLIIMSFNVNETKIHSMQDKITITFKDCNEFRPLFYN